MHAITLLTIVSLNVCRRSHFKNQGPSLECGSLFVLRHLCHVFYTGFKPRNHPSRCTRKKHPPAVEKTCHPMFGALVPRYLIVASRLASSVEKLPDDEMHDYTPTDTENVYRATLTYFTVNFTRGESGTETYTGCRRGNAMRYVPFAHVLRFLLER